MPTALATDAITRLVVRQATRTEADIQTDVSIVLLAGDLNLAEGQVIKREAQVGDGTRRRLDVAVGHCVIEVKRNLRAGKVLADAEAQLAGYMKSQQPEMGNLLAGILTDGREWLLYRLDDAGVALVDQLVLNPADPDLAERLLTWLESVLATQEALPPAPKIIAERLGAASPAHRLDHAALRAMFDDAAGNSEVALKRELWAKLLRTAFGEAFNDDPALFINHTLLVLTAESIAHAIIGFNLVTGSVSPSELVSGRKFAEAQVYGVVEADFFDWVIDVPGGEAFVADLARRVGRFDWAGVEHDVLKVLYQSIIEPAARESLGEYYTPDWLAERMVQNTVTDPLTQHVLDPSCGSGTFLFHAVRAHLVAAESAGTPPGVAAIEVTTRVVGLDVHPVAVTLARVTYLMAIGTARLNVKVGALNVPVYLGDAVQWERHTDLFTDDEAVTVATSGSELVEGGGALFGDDLVFPLDVWSADAARFDRLVSDMAAAVQTAATNAAVNPILKRHKVDGAASATLKITFDTWLRLQHSGRDRIWGYYIRNLVKPIWLAQLENRVDVLIGNPPWLRYSKMTPKMQERYRELASERGLLTGGLGASARDLSTLFVVRAVQLYLAGSGRFSFVMPHAVLSRRPHTGFRTGVWGGKSLVLNVAFAISWDLVQMPTGFPMTSCVIHGQISQAAERMPVATETWSTTVSKANVRWAEMVSAVSITPGTVIAIDAGSDRPTSHYEKVFRQGAILVPRMALLVELPPAGPLAAGTGRVEVRSRRSAQEDPKFKSMPDLTGVVETTFLHEVHLSETLAPFRPLAPLRCVLPISKDHIFSSEEIEDYQDLAEWWARVEGVWTKGRRADERKPLRERMDYHAQLSAQLPAAMTDAHRVIYPKSGSNLLAARIDPGPLIDHKLYWGSVSTLSEARYITGLLNTRHLQNLVREYQAVGLFGPRDFDKYVFMVGISAFDPSEQSHLEVVDLVAKAEEIAASVPLDQCVTARICRNLIWNALAESGVQQDLEQIASVIVSGPAA